MTSSSLHFVVTMCDSELCFNGRLGTGRAYLGGLHTKFTRVSQTMFQISVLECTLSKMIQICCAWRNLAPMALYAEEMYHLKWRPVGPTPNGPAGPRDDQTMTCFVLRNGCQTQSPSSGLRSWLLCEFIFHRYASYMCKVRNFFLNRMRFHSCNLHLRC